MTTNPREILGQIAHHEAMAEHHASTAASLRAQHQTLLGSESVNWGHGMNKRRPTKSHGRWVDWLKENGPASRKMIADSVGLLTGDVPPYANSLGLSVSQLMEASYPDDTMLRLSAENTSGNGRPMDVYFLWSQRWDVHPLFGVGPIKSTDDWEKKVLAEPGAAERVAEIEKELRLSVDTTVWPEYDPRLAVVFSEWQSAPCVAERRCATMEAWNDLHAPVFDAMVVSESKPSDEVKALLRDTLPEGEAEGPAIASAYSNAVLRSREPKPLLGVIHPPDLTGVEMVGSHNHVPHIYGPLCDIAHCIPA